MMRAFQANDFCFCCDRLILLCTCEPPRLDPKQLEIEEQRVREHRAAQEKHRFLTLTKMLMRAK